MKIENYKLKIFLYGGGWKFLLKLKHLRTSYERSPKVQSYSWLYAFTQSLANYSVAVYTEDLYDFKTFLKKNTFYYLNVDNIPILNCHLRT